MKKHKQKQSKSYIKIIEDFQKKYKYVKLWGYRYTKQQKLILLLLLTIIFLLPILLFIYSLVIEDALRNLYGWLALSTAAAASFLFIWLVKKFNKKLYAEEYKSTFKTNEIPSYSIMLAYFFEEYKTKHSISVSNHTLYNEYKCYAEREERRITKISWVKFGLIISTIFYFTKQIVAIGDIVNYFVDELGHVKAFIFILIIIIPIITIINAICESCGDRIKNILNKYDTILNMFSQLIMKEEEESIEKESKEEKEDNINESDSTAPKDTPSMGTKNNDEDAEKQ